VNIVPVGCPIPDVYAPLEVANGQTTYTASAYATDRTGTTCAGAPLKTSGITFKLWLTKPITTAIIFQQGAQFLLDNINTAITGQAFSNNKVGDDIPDLQALQFTTTSQVQQSNAQGRVNWTYTLPSTLQPGNYDLVILVDWKGQQYNWSWRNITVKQAG
jgi:hypothetical protein